MKGFGDGSTTAWLVFILRMCDDRRSSCESIRGHQGILVLFAIAGIPKL